MKRVYTNWCHGTTSALMSMATMWNSRQRHVPKLVDSVSVELELIYLSGRVKAFRHFLPLNQSDTCTNNNKIS